MAEAPDLLEFVPVFPEEDEESILERMRGWANEGLDPDVDVDEWTDTREGSQWYVDNAPTARELARLYDLAGTEAVAAGMPVWAWGSYLDDHAEVQDIERLPATRADGEARFTGEAGEMIAAGTTVSVEPPEPDAEVPEFEVVTGAEIPDAADPPANLAGVGVSGGGALPDAEDYAYVVTAFDHAGETLPSAETVEVIPAGPGHVDLTWDPVATAIGYRVYRADETGGPYGLVAEVEAVAWSDVGAVAPNMAENPPVANETGGQIVLPVRATERGVVGNVGAGAVTVVRTPGVEAAVTNDEAIDGGTEPESDESLRERVIAAYTAQGAGTRADYERWGRSWAGVGRVTVIPLWNGPGTVKLIVTTADGQPVSQETIDGLQADLDPIAGMGEGRAPISAIVTVETATARPVAVTADVEFEDGFSLDGEDGSVAMREPMTAALREYLIRVESGQEIVHAQALGRVVTLAGVHDVPNLTIDGGVINVPIDDDPAETPVLTEPVAFTAV